MQKFFKTLIPASIDQYAFPGLLMFFRSGRGGNLADSFWVITQKFPRHNVKSGRG